MLVINEQEASWDVRLLVDVVHDFGGNHETGVFAGLELGNVNYFEVLEVWEFLGDRFDHAQELVGLQLSFVHNRVVSSGDKTNDAITLFVGVEVWIHLLSELEIVDGLVVSLKVFIDGTPVVVEVGIWLFQGFLGLRVGFESMLKLPSAFVVLEKVGEMSISENVPTLRIPEIKAYCLGGHLDTCLIVLFPLFGINLVTVG